MPEICPKCGKEHATQEELDVKSGIKTKPKVNQLKPKKIK